MCLHIYQVLEEIECSAVDKFCLRFRNVLQTELQALDTIGVKREAPRDSSSIFIVPANGPLAQLLGLSLQIMCAFQAKDAGWMLPSGGKEHHFSWGEKVNKSHLLHIMAKIRKISIWWAKKLPRYYQSSKGNAHVHNCFNHFGFSNGLFLLASQ